MVLTASIMLIFTLVFIMDLANPDLSIYGLGGDTGQRAVNRELGFLPQGIIGDLSLYRFITAMFLHADFIHLVVNVVGLIAIGEQFERKIRWKKLLTIYFGSGIGAGCVVLIISPFGLLGNTMNTVSIGASGAIFGLLGAFWYLYPRERIVFPLLIIRRWSISTIFLIYAGIETLYIIMGKQDNIGHVAHVGGLVCSFPIAWLVRPGEGGKEKSAREERDLGGLRSIARTKEQRKLLDRAISEDENDIREAWLEEFFSKVSCPRCGGEGMEYGNGTARCPDCKKIMRP